LKILQSGPFPNSSLSEIDRFLIRLVPYGCKRLIENAIICWNYLYLSNALNDARMEIEKNNLVEVIKNGFNPTNRTGVLKDKKMTPWKCWEISVANKQPATRKCRCCTYRVLPMISSRPNLCENLLSFLSQITRCYGIWYLKHY
jgi:hypothetical protein